jgi:hypothetical protein
MSVAQSRAQELQYLDEVICIKVSSISTLEHHSESLEFDEHPIDPIDRSPSRIL